MPSKPFLMVPQSHDTEAKEIFVCFNVLTSCLMQAAVKHAITLIANILNELCTLLILRTTTSNLFQVIKLEAIGAVVYGNFLHALHCLIIEVKV